MLTCTHGCQSHVMSVTVMISLSRLCFCHWGMHSNNYLRWYSAVQCPLTQRRQPLLLISLHYLLYIKACHDINKKLQPSLQINESPHGRPSLALGRRQRG